MADTEAPSTLPALRLKRNEDRRLTAGHFVGVQQRGRHPADPARQVRAGRAGAGAGTQRSRALGIAYINPRSLISARLLEDLAHSRYGVVRRAFSQRTGAAGSAVPGALLSGGPWGGRDALPGLVVDRYGDRCVVQIGTAGMELLKPHIGEATIRVFGCETLIFKNDSGARELEGLPLLCGDGAARRHRDGQRRDRQHRDRYGEGREASSSRCRSPRDRKPAGSSTRPSIVVALTKYIVRGARVLDVFSYVGAWGRAGGARWSG